MNKLGQALHDYTNGQTLSAEQILHVVLVVTLVAATVHLITMVATRWGDKHIGVKSLVASLLVHVVCLLGLTSKTGFSRPPARDLEKETQAQEETEIQIRRVVESDREIRDDEYGNAPILDATEDDRELARSERPDKEFESAAAPEKEANSELLTDSPVRDVEDAATPQAPSMPEDAGLQGDRQQASARIEVDDAIEQSQSEVTANTPSREARRARAGSSDESVTREVPRGSVSRVEDVFSARDVAPDIDRADTGAFSALDNPEDMVSRSTGPTPGETEIKDPGMDTEAGLLGAAGTMSRSQVSRQRTRKTRRTGRALDDTLVERQAMTEIPLTEGFDVRESPAADPLSDSIEFAPAPEAMPEPEIRRRPSFAATYELRSLETRKEVARRNGGTEESEQAVEMSLKWLASVQKADGSWVASEHGAGEMREDVRILRDAAGNKQAEKLVVDLVKEGEMLPAGARADTGVSALALLAFLGAGYTHEEGEYTDTVDRAIRWLIEQQAEDGSLAGNATYFAKHYCHAMATYALAEALGMQKDPNSDVDLRRALVRAIGYTARMQNVTGGGWRYKGAQPGDVSMFGWQMMSLKSAEIAGVRIPAIVRQRMKKFLDSRALGRSGGLAGYRVNDRPEKTMTAEALFCRQMLGYKRDSRQSYEAVRYIMRQVPDRSDFNLYYWYYGTLAMFQYGGDDWDEWNEEVRSMLIDEQLQTGQFAGTWDPAKTRWGKAGGRVYTTAIATLTLEVYYRFLPLYRAAAPKNDDK